MIVPSTFDRWTIETSFVCGPEKPLVLLELQRPLVSDRNHPQRRALFLTHHLPGHDVGVVLHGGDHHLVSRAETCTPERLGHQIDAFGGVAREDDFVRGGCVDEALHRGAGVLERLSGALAEQVDAAMDVRIVLAVVGHQRVKHRTRLLRRRGVVQVHERFAVHGLPKNGKVLADPVHVEAGLGRRGDAGDAGHCWFAGPPAAGSSESRCSSSDFLSPSIRIRLSTSPANAWISMSRACCRSRPRARR